MRHAFDSSGNIEHEPWVRDIPMIGIGIAVLLGLRLQDIDIAEGLTVLRHPIDTEHALCLGIDDDVSPDYVVGLLVMGGHEGRSVDRTCSVVIYLIVGKEADEVFAAEEEYICLPRNGRECSDREGYIAPNIRDEPLRFEGQLLYMAGHQHEGQYANEYPFHLLSNSLAEGVIELFA